MKTLRCVVALGVTGLVVSAVLGGCSSSSRSDVVHPGINGFRDVYSQKVEWGKCPPTEGSSDAPSDAAPVIECATVLVPLDWNAPRRPDRIQLAVNRIRATGDKTLGTILTNPGGPGASGKESAAGLAQKSTTATLRKSYDLVGFDPRGIGESSPVKCADKSTIPIVNFGECVADNPLSHFMGTSSVAKDMDVLRVLVGDHTLNFFGTSYGTMLGATYATLFPKLVGRMVLDSAESAGWANLIHNYDQLVAIDQATDRYVRSCSVELTAGVQCAFNTPQSLQERIAQLTANPLKSSAGKTFDGDNLRAFITAALYDPPQARADALVQVSSAIEGDQAAIDQIISETADVSGGDAGEIVRCHSQPRVLDFRSLQQHVRDLGAKTQADVDKAIEQYGATDAGQCSVLAETGTDITNTFTNTGASPILVVAITGDHTTPYKYARELTDELGNAQLLTLNGEGHGAAYYDSACIDKNVDSYFLDGTMPGERATCTRDATAIQAPTVEIRASLTNTPQLAGRATPSDRVEISRAGGQADPQFAPVDDTGIWGPVEVAPGCYDVRAVKPGSRSEPIAVCVQVKRP